MSGLIVYVLKCESEKYYVGKTTNFKRRITDHYAGRGSLWTKKYPPTEVLETFKDCKSEDERIIVIRCMKKFGIENVRGGPYCSIVLSENVVRCLSREINVPRFGLDTIGYKMFKKFAKDDTTSQESLEMIKKLKIIQEMDPWKLIESEDKEIKKLVKVRLLFMAKG